MRLSTCIISQFYICINYEIGYTLKYLDYKYQIFASPLTIIFRITFLMALKNNLVKKDNFLIQN